MATRLDSRRSALLQITLPARVKARQQRTSDVHPEWTLTCLPLLHAQAGTSLVQLKAAGTPMVA